MANEQEKQAAARHSLSFVRDGDVVGLGTGSTAAIFIQMLGEKVKAGMKVRGIPTSTRSRDLAKSLGIPLITFADCEQIDVTVDGADEFNPDLDLIKGGGGALLREKVVASASRQVVIVTDSSKQVPALGKFPLPVEVVPFAEALIAGRVAALGASVNLRQKEDWTPYVTDEGHHILDCSFGKIAEPAKLADQLNRMPGVVEHGLFIGMASVVLMSKGAEVVEFRLRG